MSEIDFPPFVDVGSSSAPLYFRRGTGDGSLIASMISDGVVVLRYTEQGSVIPFGQDIGTPADATAIVSPIVDDDANSEDPLPSA